MGAPLPVIGEIDKMRNGQDENDCNEICRKNSDADSGIIAQKECQSTGSGASSQGAGKDR